MVSLQQNKHAVVCWSDYMFELAGNKEISFNIGIIVVNVTLVVLAVRPSWHGNIIPFLMKCKSIPLQFYVALAVFLSWLLMTKQFIILIGIHTQGITSTVKLILQFDEQRQVGVVKRHERGIPSLTAVILISSALDSR